MSAGLFDRPFDLDAIEAILRDDSDRFGMATAMMAGFRKRFDVIVCDAKEVYETFKAQGRDLSGIKKIVSYLCDGTQGRWDRIERRDALLAAFDFVVLVTAPPQEQPKTEMERSREWLTEYRRRGNRP